MSSTTSTKKIDFAGLVELFDTLASRRSRLDTFTPTGNASSTKSNAASHADEMLDAVPISPDLEPIVRNLASLVDLRQADERKRQQKFGMRARSHTVAGPATPLLGITDEPNHPDSQIDPETNNFPLGQDQRYPFTFKLMLHKLYELEEWGQKVRDVLATSQSQYKPLAEDKKFQSAMKKENVEVKERLGVDGRVRFAPGRAPTGRRVSGSYARQRSKTISTPNTPSKGSAGPGPKPKPLANLGAAPVAEEVSDEIRAIKKRCIGRRKSFGALKPGQVNTTARGWVYDAAASSVIIGDGKNSARRRRGDSLAAVSLLQS